MNNKGFTLMELLAGIVIVGILFGMVFYLLRGTFGSTMTQYNMASDNMIFEAADSYALEYNAFGNNDYACVTVKELGDYGYLKNVGEDTRIIKIIRNGITKVIEETKYVDEC